MLRQMICDLFVNGPIVLINPRLLLFQVSGSKLFAKQNESLVSKCESLLITGTRCLAGCCYYRGFGLVETSLSISIVTPNESTNAAYEIKSNTIY
jgi:uncharacterized membrane protein